MSAVLPLLRGTFPPVQEFLPALIIGILFGVALEVAGFGNAKFLAGQFYFHYLRVFKVMFTAIVTAATGVAILASTGLLALDLVYFPDTFLVPLLVGGFVLGAGFMLSAYCPGTSIVAAASWKWDGLATVVGVIARSALFGEIYPFISGFYVSTAKGVMTFPRTPGHILSGSRRRPRSRRKLLKKHGVREEVRFTSRSVQGLPDPGLE